MVTVPLGLGIALNPVAIIASILIVRSTSARGPAVALIAGWVIGLALLEVLILRLMQFDLEALFEWAAVVPALFWIGMGVVLLVVGAHALRTRPLPGAEPEPSRLLRFIDRAGKGKKVGAGIVLSTVSVRNLALLAAASSLIGQADLSRLELLLTVTIFVAVSSLGVLTPFLVRNFAGEDADARLETWSRWLNLHMGTITAAVLFALGSFLVGLGLRALL